MSDKDHEPGILATCQDLHMLATGALDGMPEDEALRLENYLQRKLDGWRVLPAVTSYQRSYDLTVHTLIVVTLAEWRACPWHPRASKVEAAR